MTAINLTVKVNGGIFGKNMPDTVRTAVKEEILLQLADRFSRKGAQGSGGKGKGVQNNEVGTAVDVSGLRLLSTSTKNWPRTVGTNWQRKNIAIAKAMAPRVGKKAAERIVAELGQG